jgi:Flp pilus assembly protein TadG
MSRTDREPRGVTIILVVVVLAVIGGFMALALNVGHLAMVRGQLQNGADSSALAAARELNGTSGGITSARGMAVDFAGRHATDATDGPARNQIVIDPSADVTFGNWNYGLRRFDSTETNPRRINAVRVQTARESADANAVPVYARFLGGASQVDVRTHAIAACGVPCDAQCPMPFALPACQLYNPLTGKLDCSAPRTFNNDIVDNICYTNLTDEATGTPPPACNNASNECSRKIIQSDYCVEVKAGYNIALTNGADLNQPVAQTILDYIHRVTGNPDANQVDAIVPIVEVPDCTCNHAGLVKGFAKFTITVVTMANGQLEVLFGTQCDEYESSGSAGACEYFGTATTAQASLVE